MTMRWAMAALGLGLAACQPAPVADSAGDRMGGVGFGDYEAYLTERQAREAQLSGRAPSAPEATGAPTAAMPGLTASDLAAAGIGVTESVARPPAPGEAGGAAAGGGGGAPLAAPGLADAPPPQPEGAAPASGRADGQDFAAVPAREAIGGDAAQSQRQRAAGQPGTPAEAPPPAAASGPDIVAYALQTTHEVGEPRYSRFLASEARAQRRCARYPGADLAQRAFLEAGGPQRDRLGLDPDGDGFACGWDPAPFRAARG
jgi:hypothetical protein